MQARPPRGRALGCVGVALVLATVISGASLAFVLADHLGGPVAAVSSVVAFFSLPLSIGVGVERVATRLHRELRAERVAAYLVPVFALAILVLAFSVLRATTGSALAEVPTRYAWTRGVLGDSLRRVGVLLGPSAAPPAVEPPPLPSAAPARPEASAPPSRPAGDADADDAAPRYASGDPAYREAADCETLADVSELSKAYTPGGKRAAVQALAAARYPTGLPFLKAQNDTQLLAWFTGAPDSFAGVASRFEAAVHEGSHIWSFSRFNLGAQTYPIAADLSVSARRLKNFPRSEILQVHVDVAADQYAKTYLEGASGAQGFNSLLDEYNAYAHSLASRYCTRDLMLENSRGSARDGILTFMYYVETYLELGRTRHPGDYAAILADPGHRKVILTVWDRAELWLRRSAKHPSLGIADDTIRGWVYEPARLAEIARVRAAQQPKPP